MYFVGRIHHVPPSNYRIIELRAIIELSQLFLQLLVIVNDIYLMLHLQLISQMHSKYFPEAFVIARY
ncbi:hypothetical protein D3C78_1971190 [compost metagenome]